MIKSLVELDEIGNNRTVAVNGWRKYRRDIIPWVDEVHDILVGLEVIEDLKIRRRGHVIVMSEKKNCLEGAGEIRRNFYLNFLNEIVRNKISR